MSRYDERALRAELGARNEEIATLRGVVAALRSVLGRRGVERERRPSTRVTIRPLALALGVGVLLGFAAAMALVEWLRS